MNDYLKRDYLKASACSGPATKRIWVKILTVAIHPPIPVDPAGGRGGRETVVDHVVQATIQIFVGRPIGRCARCAREAPGPGADQLLELDVGDLVNLHGQTLVVGDGDLVDAAYLPHGWHVAYDAKGECRILCGDCYPLVAAALSAAFKAP